MATVVDVRLSGPLFRTPGAVAEKHATAALQEIVEKGEEHLAQMLRPRPAGVYLSVAQARKGQASTGNYRRHLQTRVDTLQARISDGGVIYGPWLEGTSSRNSTTRFKGYFSFRNTKDWINSTLAKQVLAKHGKALAQELGGR